MEGNFLMESGHGEIKEWAGELTASSICMGGPPSKFFQSWVSDYIIKWLHNLIGCEDVLSSLSKFHRVFRKVTPFPLFWNNKNWTKVTKEIN